MLYQIIGRDVLYTQQKKINLFTISSDVEIVTTPAFILHDYCSICFFCSLLPSYFRYHSLSLHNLPPSRSSTLFLSLMCIYRTSDS